MATTEVQPPNEPEEEVQEMPEAEPLAVAPDVYFAEDNTKEPEDQKNTQKEVMTEAQAQKAAEKK